MKNKELDKWIIAVNEVRDGYILTRDDYTNDLCIRNSLKFSKLNSQENKQLEEADIIFKDYTIVLERPQLKEETDWWWFRVPKKIGTRFKNDLFLLDFNTSQLEVINEFD